MKKLFIVCMMVAFATGSSFAQGLQSSKSNAPAGAANFYENLYGTTIGSSRAAMDAVVYTDLTLQNDFVIAGLTNLGYNVTVAISWSDFNTKLASGNYGLAVGFNQNSGNGVSGPAIQTFLAGGGCMIYCDWTMSGDIANIFEANFTGSTNQSFVSISDAGLAGSLTNPVVLSNPGWGIFSTGLTAIGAGQVLATFENGNAAVVRGNGGKSIMLGYLSDTPLLAERQQLFENVVNATLCGTGEVPVPISGWAIFFGIFLMITFVAFRFAKAS